MKKSLLIVAATASVVIATAAGMYYWDSIVLGFLAALVWLKKIATFQGFLILLKKMPLLLLLGLKRLAIKVTSHFLLFTAHLRFHQMQRLLRYLRARARMVKMRLKYHWSGLTALEQVLATVAALPLVIILSVLMLIFLFPKVLLAFLVGKLKEYSGALVIKQVADLGVGDELTAAEKKIKEQIRKNIPPEEAGQSVDMQRNSNE
jgi:hypothetical protein